MVTDSTTGEGLFFSQELDLVKADYEGNELVRRRALAESIAWLDEQFPQYADAAAYWPT